MRSPLDENQPKPFTKPYANQVKQYPGQSIEPTPNAVPSPNPDAEKRPIQTGPPQVMHNITLNWSMEFVFNGIFPFFKAFQSPTNCKHNEHQSTG